MSMSTLLNIHIPPSESSGGDQNNRELPCMYNKKLTQFAGHIELLQHNLTSTAQKGIMI